MAGVRAVLDRLIDDAAVFPPGNAPLDVAVRGHATHRRSWYAACVGPLLVPAGLAGELPGVLDACDWPAAAPLDVGIIGRPGSEAAHVRSGVASLADEPRVRVVGVELPWSPQWRAVGADGVLIALEVGRGPRQVAALDALARDNAAGHPVVAKFRTGPTPTWHWPDEIELAAFIVETVRASVPFKLTGGLHHALRGTYPSAAGPEENHGLLNVLAATTAALRGSDVPLVSALLSERHPDRLGEAVTGLEAAGIAELRAAFRSYGCCLVTDPVDELAALGVLEPDTFGLERG